MEIQPNTLSRRAVAVGLLFPEVALDSRTRRKEVSMEI